MFVGCQDGVIEQKASEKPLMRRNPDTSRPCYTDPVHVGRQGESRQRQEFPHMRNCLQEREVSLYKRAGARPKNTSLFQTFKLFEKEWKWFIVKRICELYIIRSDAYQIYKTRRYTLELIFALVRMLVFFLISIYVPFVFLYYNIFYMFPNKFRDMSTLWIVKILWLYLWYFWPKTPIRFWSA